MDLEEMLNLRRRQLQEELVPKPLRRKIFRGVAIGHVLLILGPVAMMIVIGWFAVEDEPEEAILTVEFVNPNADDPDVGGPVGEGGPPQRDAYKFEDIPEVTKIPEKDVKLETPDIPKAKNPEPKQPVKDTRADELAKERERLEKIKKQKARDAAEKAAAEKAAAKKAEEEKRRKEKERQEAAAREKRAREAKEAAEKAAVAQAAANARALLANNGTGVKNPTPNGGVGGKGVVGASFDSKLKAFVNMHWKGLVPSRQQLNGRTPVAEIELLIHANGKIINVTFSRQSGVPAMDDAVRSLMKRLVGATVPMAPGEQIKRLIELQID